MQRIDLTERRANRIGRLTDTELDVLVVGGGIVGAGIARDAAMRGLRTGLVEQHDFAFGTSSRSSRLLHGGLRYLAQGRVGLVREASREKRILHHIARHLAEPLPFVFPTYRGTPWPLWQLRLGVKLYDLLCGRRNLGPSSCLGAAELREHVPGIDTRNLTGAVRYFDALTNDSRLVLDTLRSADLYGAIVCNYTRLEDARHCVFRSGRQGGAGWQCQVRDMIAQQCHELTARTVVNATGPWSATLPNSSIRLRLTKGVHLVVDRGRLPVPDAVVMAQDRRILFAITWGQRVILGTTDTDYSGPIETASPAAGGMVDSDSHDVDYILGVVNAAFPAAKLSIADVISTWAGLRPLIATGRAGPSDISRAHLIRMPHPGWLDVAGGKLTTYRLIAQQAVDRLLSHLGHSDACCGRRSTACCGGRSAARCRTAEEPLLEPGPLSNTGVQGVSGILPPAVTAEVVEHYCRNEWAVHLDDVMRRRTSWHYYHTDADQLAHRVAGWMTDIYGWDAAKRQAELRRILGSSRR